MKSKQFETLYTMDVKQFVEKKGKLSYLSWAHAIRLMKSVDPLFNFEVLWSEFLTLPDGTMIVKTKCSSFVDDCDEPITHECWLPVMDHRNKAVSNPDAFLLNKTIMRCLVKNIGMFGLGLSLYAGEDLPSDFDVEKATNPKAARFEKMVNHFKTIGESEQRILAHVGKKSGNDLTDQDYADLQALFLELKAAK